MLHASFRTMDTILYFQPQSQPYIPEKVAGVRAIASRRGTNVQMVNRDPTAGLVAELAAFWHAIALIRSKACEGLRAADVAARFPCSRRLACVRFRKATGRTMLDEIHAVQLETAKRILETTDIPLKALSDFCGFEDPNSLRKFFRRETGTTLRAWRAAHGRIR